MRAHLPPDDAGDQADGDGGECIHLHVSRSELLLLAGSVNEAIEAVEPWEFPIRLGADPDDARRLRAQLGEVIRRLPPE